MSCAGCLAMFLPRRMSSLHSPFALRRSRLAAWRPFLTGVAVGLAFLAVIGVAFAQPLDHAPFDALLKANVRNGVVHYSGFQDNAAFKKYVDDLAKPTRLDGKPETQKYIARYASDADVAQALGSDAYKVEWIDYDWNLNGTPPRR